MVIIWGCRPIILGSPGHSSAILWPKPVTELVKKHSKGCAGDFCPNADLWPGWVGRVSPQRAEISQSMSFGNGVRACERIDHATHGPMCREADRKLGGVAISINRHPSMRARHSGHSSVKSRRRKIEPVTISIAKFIFLANGSVTTGSSSSGATARPLGVT